MSVQRRQTPNFAAELVAFLLHVLEVPVSNLEPGSEYSDLHFHGFSQFIQTNVGKMPPVRTIDLIKTLLEGF
jgi:hypothetical protein